MRLSKNRLEAFSDGVIAIIITIMVLEIPLPESFEFNNIMKLLFSILVYFVSFFIVGMQWNNHRHIFDTIEEVSNKVLYRNLLFLFFLSLMPLFTKWVIENPDRVAPAIGYNIVFLMVNFSYQFIRMEIIKDIIDKKYKKEVEELKAEGKFGWLRFIIFIVLIAGIVAISVFYPRVSLILFMALPVGASMFNLIFEHDHEKIKRKRLQKMKRG